MKVEMKTIALPIELFERAKKLGVDPDSAIFVARAITNYLDDCDPAVLKYRIAEVMRRSLSDSVETVELERERERLWLQRHRGGSEYE